MKERLLIFITSILLCIRVQVFAQNLVPNGSFETFTQCPAIGDKIYYATGWFQPNKYPWSNSVNQSSSTDYYNSCAGNGPYTSVPNNFFGYQNAVNGNAYIGMVYFHTIANYREYAEIKLVESLVAGKEYILNYYISLTDGARYATNQFDAYFSQDSLLVTSMLEVINVAPHIINTNQSIVSDTMNWTQISGTYTAVGGERFLTLGNFHNNIGSDTIHVNYSLQSQNDYFAYYYIDDVSLVEDSSTGIKELENAGFELFPNPAQNTIQVLFQEDVIEISIVDLCGKELIHVEPIGSSLSIDCASLANGIYIVQCKFREGNLLHKKIIMQH
jgi:Secretion system C-terminal sorting domain